MILNFLTKTRGEGGGVKERLSYNPYIFMSMEIWPGDWKNQLERMNMKVDEENGKAMGMVNGQAWRV